MGISTSHDSYRMASFIQGMDTVGQGWAEALFAALIGTFMLTLLPPGQPHGFTPDCIWMTSYRVGPLRRIPEKLSEFFSIWTTLTTTLSLQVLMTELLLYDFFQIIYSMSVSSLLPFSLHFLLPSLPSFFPSMHPSIHLSIHSSIQTFTL